MNYDQNNKWIARVFHLFSPINVISQYIQYNVIGDDGDNDTIFSSLREKEQDYIV